MPTYQYACTECDHAFEQVQAFSDDALTECPECEGRLRKLFNAVGVVFKGSGFYRTDSRAKNGSSDSKTDTKTETKAETKSDGKSDTKSDAKSDTKSSSDTSSSSTAAKAPATTK